MGKEVVGLAVRESPEGRLADDLDKAEQNRLNRQIGVEVASL